MSSPHLIPSFLLPGEQQYVVIEFKYDLPQGCHLITLTFLDPRNNALHNRIPVDRIGPKTVKAFLPVFTRCGKYTVVPKFDLEEQPAFPRFNIMVLSPLETIRLCLVSKTTTAGGHTACVAALLAYLIQLEQRGEQENMELFDEILYSIVPQMDIPFTNLSTFLAGNYSSDNLLHFALRNKLVWTSDWLARQELVQDSASKLFLSPGQDRLTPAAVARRVGLKSTAEAIDQQEAKLRAQTYEKFFPAQNEENMTEALEQSDGADLDATTKWSKIRDFSKQFKKLKKAVAKSMHKGSDDGSALQASGSMQLAQNFIEQLKATALYTAQISTPYTYHSEMSGPVSLQIGETVFVIREEDGMCRAIAQDKYCELPMDIMQPIATEEEEFSDDSDESHDYEEVQHPDHNMMIAHVEVNPPDIKAKRLSRFPQPVKSSSFDSGLDEVGSILNQVLPPRTAFRPNFEQSRHMLPSSTKKLQNDQQHRNNERPLLPALPPKRDDIPQSPSYLKRNQSPSFTSEHDWQEEQRPLPALPPNKPGIRQQTDYQTQSQEERPLPAVPPKKQNVSGDERPLPVPPTKKQVIPPSFERKGSQQNQFRHEERPLPISPNTKQDTPQSPSFERKRTQTTQEHSQFQFRQEEHPLPVPPAKKQDVPQSPLFELKRTQAQSQSLEERPLPVPPPKKQDLLQSFEANSRSKKEERPLPVPPLKKQSLSQSPPSFERKGTQHNQSPPSSPAAANDTRRRPLPVVPPKKHGVSQSSSIEKSQPVKKKPVPLPPKKEVLWPSPKHDDQSDEIEDEYDDTQQFRKDISTQAFHTPPLPRSTQFQQPQVSRNAMTPPTPRKPVKSPPPSSQEQALTVQEMVSRFNQS